MTESTGKRPRIVAQFVDDVPRSLTQWARYFNINNQTMRDRERKYGSLLKAIYALRDGTEKIIKKGHGLCRKGHRVEGDNILIRLEKGVEQKRCRECYYKPPKPRRPKKVRLKKPPRFPIFIIESIDTEARTISAWARYAGVDDLVLRKHLKRGTPLEEAVNGLKDGTLRRRTKDNPAGYRPVHPNARRHMCAIPRVDDVKRGIREWAEYLGMKFATLNKRVDKGMTLEQAVLFTLDNAWTVRNTGGKCRRGHVLTEREGKKQRICLVCARENARVSGKLLRQKRKKPKTNLCRAGVHKVVGDNVLMLMYPDGVRRPTCRACRYLYQNRRNALKRAGKWKVAGSYGKSLEEKIAYHSMKVGSCVLWTGTIDANGLPKAYYKDERGVSMSVLVRSYLWLKRHGTPLPKLHVTKATCKNRLCIADGHVICVPLREVTQSPEARAKRRQVVRLGPAANDIAQRVMVFANDVKALVGRRGALLREEVEDVMQEVALRVCFKWKKGTPIRSLRAFVMTVAKNVTEDWRRAKLHRRMDRTDRLDDDHGDGMSVGDTLIGESMLMGNPEVLLDAMESYEIEAKRYRDRLKRMGEKMRHVFELRASGLSQRDIADKLGISENTIEQHLQRAYRVMRGRYNSKAFEVLHQSEGVPL